jgi:UDP-N-acetylglucosamine 2-epimerase (non-hydrolysing)
MFSAMEIIAQEYPIVFSCHPKTRQRLMDLDLNISDRIILLEPLSFFDFVCLEKNSYMAISDSGTVQEEMCLFHIPTVTIRSTTERPETVWCGSNIVTGLEVDNIVAGYQAMKSADRCWTVPIEYARTNVSNTVINILLGTVNGR